MYGLNPPTPVPALTPFTQWCYVYLSVRPGCFFLFLFLQLEGFLSCKCLWGLLLKMPRPKLVWMLWKRWVILLTGTMTTVTVRCRDITGRCWSVFQTNAIWQSESSIWGPANCSDWRPQKSSQVAYEQACHVSVEGSDPLHSPTWLAPTHWSPVRPDSPV